MNEFLLLIFQLAVLLFSVIIHEVSHGVTALKLGDRTAQNAGRLTLNPLKHLDFFGSFILPISLFLLSGGGFVLGWAKPVPYNPFNLKNPKSGGGIIAAMGPLSNFLVATIFAVILRFLVYPFAETAPIAASLFLLINIIIFINILLAVFNLLPLPPLDGSSILFSLLPDSWSGVRAVLQQYGFFLLILFIFFGFQYLLPIINGIYKFLVGPAAFF